MARKSSAMQRSCGRAGVYLDSRWGQVPGGLWTRVTGSSRPETTGHEWGSHSRSSGGICVSLQGVAKRCRTERDGAGAAFAMWVSTAGAGASDGKRCGAASNCGAMCRPSRLSLDSVGGQRRSEERGCDRSLRSKLAARRQRSGKARRSFHRGRTMCACRHQQVVRRGCTGFACVLRPTWRATQSVRKCSQFADGGPHRLVRSPSWSRQCSLGVQKCQRFRGILCGKPRGLAHQLGRERVRSLDLRTGGTGFHHGRASHGGPAQCVEFGGIRVGSEAMASNPGGPPLIAGPPGLPHVRRPYGVESTHWRSFPGAGVGEACRDRTPERGADTQGEPKGSRGKGIGKGERKEQRGGGEMRALMGMWANDLHRELMPLPVCLERIRCKKGALSKVVLKRLRRRQSLARQRAVDAVASALNEMWGYDAAVVASLEVPPTQQRLAVLLRIFRALAKPARPCQPTRETFEAFLKLGLGYGDELTDLQVAPYQEGLTSLPENATLAPKA
eukprot:6464799-Amphidinium_carterae.2